MKKIFLIFPVLLFFWNFGNSQNATFDDYIIDSEKIEHSLLEKVFPGVEFLLQKSDITRPPQYRVIGKLINQTFYLPSDDINRLFKVFEKNKNASLENKLEAFLILFYYQRGDSINPLKFELDRFSRKIDNKEFNYKASYELHNEIYSIHFIIEKDQIKHYLIFRNGSYYTGGSFSIIKDKNKAINIYINITPETFNSRDNYFVQVSNNGNATNNTVEFEITGLQQNQLGVYLKVVPVTGYGSIPFLSQLLTVDQYGGANYIWTPQNSNQTGICEVLVDEGMGNITYLQNFNLHNSWLIPEKILTGPLTNGFDYTIYYCDQFFINHTNGINHSSVFSSNVKQALLDSWDKQVSVTNWNLCQGLTNNVPIDLNYNYEVFINEAIDQTSWLYHGTSTTAASGGNERIIQIGARFHQWNQIGLNNYQPENDLILSAVAHEFYHGIQWSHNNSWGSGDWMIEGQARFLQTVFMNEYSSPGEEFELGRLFQSDANTFTTQQYLNKSWISPFLYRYEYCLFWRFLYENYITGGSPKQKLEIIRETCRGNTSSTLSGIKSFMNTELIGGGGSFNNMNHALNSFAKRIYFNNPNYNQWNPNPPNFYNDVYLTQSLTYTGTPLSPIMESIPSSFGMDFYEIEFTSTGSVNIAFDGDPDNNGNMSDFSVNVMIVDGSPNTPSDDFINLTSGEGNKILNITNTNHKVVVIIVRLDANEGTVEDNYELNIGSGLQAEFTYSPPMGPPGVQIVFNNQSTGNINHVSWSISQLIGTGGTATFENGTGASSYNPVVNFGQSGDVGDIYEVTLWVSEDNVTGDTEIKLIPICEDNKSCIDDMVSFYATVDEIITTQVYPGENVVFHDNSSINAVGWLWEFPGGTTNNPYVEKPTVTYYSPGIYDVTLYAIPDAVECPIPCKTESGYIEVLENNNLEVYADFTWSPIIPVVNEDVDFTGEIYNNILPVTGWEWIMDEVSPNPTGKEVTLSWSNPGQKTIRLIVELNDGEIIVESDPVEVNIDNNFWLMAITATPPYYKSGIIFTAEISSSDEEVKGDYTWTSVPSATILHYQYTSDGKKVLIVFNETGMHTIKVTNPDYPNQTPEFIVNVIDPPDVNASLAVSSLQWPKDEPLEFQNISINPPPPYDYWKWTWFTEGYNPPNNTLGQGHTNDFPSNYYYTGYSQVGNSYNVGLLIYRNLGGSGAPDYLTDKSWSESITIEIVDPGLKISPTEILDLTHKGGAFQVSLENMGGDPDNWEWIVVIPDDYSWLHVSGPTFGMGNSTVTIEYDPFYGPGTLRYATIDFYAPGLQYNTSRTLNLTQKYYWEKLTGSLCNDDQFGNAVSITDNVAVIGEHRWGDNRGEVSFYSKDVNGDWISESYTTIFNPGSGSGAHFGASVSSYGKYAIVGAPYPEKNHYGLVFIFEKVGSNWIHQDDWSPSGDDVGIDKKGASVDMYGNWAVAGCPLADNGDYEDEGKVQMYLLEDGDWGIYGYIELDEHEVEAHFGSSVSIWKDILLVGAPGVSSTGDVIVFQNNNGVWNLFPDQDLAANGASDAGGFGYSVGIYENYIVVGAPYTDVQVDLDAINNAGAVYTYYIDNDEIVFMQKLTSCFPDSDDNFGASVSIHGNFLMVGEPYKDDYNNNWNDVGEVCVYKLNENDEWELWNIFKSDNAQDDGLFGTAVCISDNNMIIGAPGEMDYRQGAAYILADFNNPCDLNIDKCDEELLTINYGEILAESVTLGGLGCNFLVPPGASIDYSANQIIMGDGFTASEGSYFTASSFDDCIFNYSMPLNPYVCVVPDEFIEKDEEILVVNEIVEDGLHIYPNPVTNELNIASTGSLVNNVIVLDLHGRIIFEKQNLNTTHLVIDFSEFSPGMFYLSIKITDSEYSGKIIHK